MTTLDLQNILMDEKRVITLKELKQCVYEMRCDVMDQLAYADFPDDRRQWHFGYYTGENNAFTIVLDLLDHLG